MLISTRHYSHESSFVFSSFLLFCFDVLSCIIIGSLNRSSRSLFALYQFTLRHVRNRSVFSVFSISSLYLHFVAIGPNPFDWTHVSTFHCHLVSCFSSTFSARKEHFRLRRRNMFLLPSPIASDSFGLFVVMGGHDRSNKRLIQCKHKRFRSPQTLVTRMLVTNCSPQLATTCHNLRQDIEHEPFH